jgi:hypothetical protein
MSNKTAVYRVTFELEIALSPEQIKDHENGGDDDLLVEEAIDMLLHEEAHAHRDGATEDQLDQETFIDEMSALGEELCRKMDQDAIYLDIQKAGVVVESLELTQE